MLDKNYAGTTASIIRSTFPNITAPKQTDLVSMLDQVGKDYQTGLQVRADNKLTDEMIAQNPEDEARIRQMGGRAYADMLKSDAQRAEERQWHLDDLESQRQFQRDLLRDKLNNEFALAKYKAQFDTAPQGTNAQQNVQAMIEAGYTPQEAWAMYYGGNNPTLDMASLGQKGQEAYDKAQGEALAKQEEKRRLAEESDTRLRAVQEKLQSSPDTVGFYSPLKTFVARALGELGDKEYLGNRGYNMRALGEVQNALIAEAKASGQSGINTAREIEQATKGLNENSSQAEVNGALQAMQDSIQRLRDSQKPSLKQFSQTPSDDDAWGGI